MGKNKRTGEVKWFNKEIGYGFIEVSGIEDVFVHYSGIAVGRKGTKILHEGDTVEFDIVPDKKGPRAENIILLKENRELDEDINLFHQNDLILALEKLVERAYNAVKEKKVSLLESDVPKDGKINVIPHRWTINYENQNPDYPEIIILEHLDNFNQILKFRIQIKNESYCKEYQITKDLIHTKLWYLLVNKFQESESEFLNSLF